MPKAVSVEIDGKTYSGVASDMDGFFAAGLLMPDFEEILAKNKGLNEAFQRFAAEQQAMSAIAADGNFMNAISQTWGERALLRLLYNREIGLSFTQRVRNIFKDMPKELVNYERWTESGRLYEEFCVGLDMGQVMEVLSAMMTTLNDVAAQVPAEPAKAIAKPVTPAAIDDEVAKLEAQIKQLKSSGKGFG